MSRPGSRPSTAAPTRCGCWWRTSTRARARSPTWTGGWRSSGWARAWIPPGGWRPRRWSARWGRCADTPGSSGTSPRRRCGWWRPAPPGTPPTPPTSSGASASVLGPRARGAQRRRTRRTCRSWARPPSSVPGSAGPGSGPYLVVDIGGGSTEFVVGDAARPAEPDSRGRRGQRGVGGHRLCPADRASPALRPAPAGRDQRGGRGHRRRPGRGGRGHPGRRPPGPWWAWPAR